MFLLGLDLGSSAVKATLLDAATGRIVSSAQSPAAEMPINAPQSGWAEQDPVVWWEHAVKAIGVVLAKADARKVRAIGISYQMHGLVTVDANNEVVRPAIIWCDSRAVSIGAKAFADLGAKTCLGRLLNSPGNFTASKLRWVQENEPANFSRIRKIMLPGDYLALRLTGATLTTASGLSEGALWDFSKNAPADFLLKHWGIDSALLPALTPTFGMQASVLPAVASALGLPADIPVAYRAGDQPNNAFRSTSFSPATSPRPAAPPASFTASPTNSPTMSSSASTASPTSTTPPPIPVSACSSASTALAFSTPGSAAPLAKA